LAEGLYTSRTEDLLPKDQNKHVQRASRLFFFVQSGHSAKQGNKFHHGLVFQIHSTLILTLLIKIVKQTLLCYVISISDILNTDHKTFDNEFYFAMRLVSQICSILIYITFDIKIYFAM
jgi:hypothetical protein